MKFSFFEKHLVCIDGVVVNFLFVNLEKIVYRFMRDDITLSFVNSYNGLTGRTDYVSRSKWGYPFPITS